MTTLREAVKKYIVEKKTASPYDLVNDLLPQYYPVSDVVLSAAKYFTSIIKRKDFCVDQEKLGEYNIVTLRDSNGKSQIGNILKLLDQYNRIEGKDYLRLNIEKGSFKSVERHYAIEYKLTPKTFFLCLIRSKKSYEFAEYYSHVLEIYDYYEEYFTSMYKQENMELKVENVKKEHENISMSTRIDILLKRMDEQTKKMDEQTKQMDEQTKQMIEQNKKTDEENKKREDENKKRDKQNDDQMKKLDRQSEQLSELQVTVNKISNKLDSCAHMPDNNELSDRFVVMKSAEDYYVIRAQDRNIYNAIKRQEDKGYKRISDLIESETIPNSIYLWNTIKDELIKEKKIKTFRNTFKLDIPECDFIKIVKTIFDQRKEYN